MKRQSTLVLDLKQKIQATLKLIALRVKSLILQLLDLENQLEQAMSEQLDSTVKDLLAVFNERRDCLQESDSSQMPHLVGSHKQVIWAHQIRQEMVEWWTTVAEEFPEMLSDINPEKLAKVFQTLLWETDAGFWIKNRELGGSEFASL
jgi:hypothetical protein